MPSAKKNHYEVLGVQKSATQQEIRRRYRELVRIYHPDVHPDKELSHVLLIQILEAYRILSNPSSRAEYDRRLECERTASTRSASAPSSSSPPPPRDTPPPSENIARRVNPAEINRLLSNARLDYLAGNLRSASATCRRIIQIDRRNAPAHMILGDIYRAQGHRDEAMAMYTLAVQFEPANPEIRQRMDRLIDEENTVTEQTAGSRQIHRTELLRLAVWCFGSASVMGCLLLLSAFPGTQAWPEIPIISQWSENLLITLSGISIIIGMLLALTRSVQRADREFVFSTVRLLPGGRRQSYGITIIILTLVWYYMGFLAYVILSGNNETISASILKAYGAALAAVALVSLVVPEAAGQLFLVGANISFGGILLGWVLGDFFRAPA